MNRTWHKAAKPVIATLEDKMYKKKYKTMN